MVRPLIVFLVFTMIGGTLLGSGEEIDPWKRLKNLKIIKDVKTYPNLEKKQKYPDGKLYVIEMAPIREALEKSGINEPVEIEIHSNRSLVERLGTYAPTVKTGPSKTTVRFNSIPLGLRIAANFLKMESEGDKNRAGKGSTWGKSAFSRFYAVFKNAKGKIKARLRVNFLYIKR